VTSVDVVLADTIRVGLCAPEDEVLEEEQLELDDAEDECVVLETILLANPDELNIDVPNPEEEEFEPPADFHEFRDRWPDHLPLHEMSLWGSSINFSHSQKIPVGVRSAGKTPKKPPQTNVCGGPFI
jgi:hypothetical protein